MCGENFVGLGDECEFATLLYLQAIGTRFVKIPRGMIEDVLVQVDKFYYLVDFFVLDTDLVAVFLSYLEDHS